MQKLLSGAELTDGASQMTSYPFQSLPLGTLLHQLLLSPRQASERFLPAWTARCMRIPRCGGGQGKEVVQLQHRVAGPPAITAPPLQ